MLKLPNEIFPDLVMHDCHSLIHLQALFKYYESQSQRNCELRNKTCQSYESSFMNPSQLHSLSKDTGVVFAQIS
jgi:hypothetical protein